MKALLQTFSGKLFKPVILTLMVFGALLQNASAQLAECATGTTMYAIFNDSTGSTAATPSDIRPVNYSTGAVGGLMGGTTFLIQKTVSGTTYYGSAALGVDGVSGRFYVVTQMSNAMAKDVISINTLTNTQTVIATTPSNSGGTTNIPFDMDDYHFVKMGISPTGVGYMIGVLRDSTLQTAQYCNPVLRFTACATANCAGSATATSGMKLIGFLASTPSMFTRWQLYNGDIAFDANGNMYFATAAYTRVNGIGRYTNARLVRVDAANLPNTPNANNVIPMTYIADYNALDSTVVNGIAFNPLGQMYFATRRYTAVQSNPAPPFTNELYRASMVGTVTQVATFGPIPAGKSIADLGSCYFPLTVLADNKLKLSGKYLNNASNLTWSVNSNPETDHYEVQSSDNGIDFKTIGSVNASMVTVGLENYAFNDDQSQYGTVKYYRIRQVMGAGMNFYSNVVKLNLNSKMHVVSSIRPNPFVSSISLDVQLTGSSTIDARLLDQSGRAVYNAKFAGNTGSNKINIDNLDRLKAGIYVLELNTEGGQFREKIVKL